MLKFDFIVIGGGAAGFFAAINAAELNPTLKIAIIEKSKEGLLKVKVSGGGRCNVTNQIQEPENLINQYPRGHKSLLFPFSTFGSKETFEWFEKRKVKLKIEQDGRVFPQSNSSSTIIELFKTEVKRLNIKVFYSEKISKINKIGNKFELLGSSETFQTDKLLVATGSDQAMLEIMKNLQISIIDQVPSLFTFNINDPELHLLAGTSFPRAMVNINGKCQEGPLLITHWGLSGPAILKSSAWEALDLYQKNYIFEVKIDFTDKIPLENFVLLCKNQIDLNPRKNVNTTALFGMTSKFWAYVCKKATISEHQKWAETGKKQWRLLYDAIFEVVYEVEGKSTFKEEFVTAGGISIDAVRLINFESIEVEGLFFAGEILNYDGITGGFNFQTAWTTAYLVAAYIAKN